MVKAFELYYPCKANFPIRSNNLYLQQIVALPNSKHLAKVITSLCYF